MFRKPKRKLKDTIRKRNDDIALSGHTSLHGNDEENDEIGDESEVVRQDIMASKHNNTISKNSMSTKLSETSQKSGVMHSYKSNESSVVSSDLVTSIAEHHPEVAPGSKNDNLLLRDDGIYRGDQVRNKFHAGPIRAATHVRVTARFDYQPDICKDYKETGFCGYGDTCIYLHDRGDTMTGWQLEHQWEEQQKLKKMKQEQEMNDFVKGISVTGEDGKVISDDGIPFACHICREHFKDPVVTTCMHYFCEMCIMNHVRTVSESCPICGKDTGSVFNLPTKLISKKRKILGNSNNQDIDSWKQYFDSFSGNSTSS